MRIEIRYSWRIRWMGRATTSPVKMTEAEAMRQHPEAQRMDNTREECVVLDQPCEIEAAINANTLHGSRHPFISRLRRPRTIPQEPETIPLPHPPEDYLIDNEGDVWRVRVKCIAPGLPAGLAHEIYRGPGPVSVELTPR